MSTFTTVKQAPRGIKRSWLLVFLSLLANIYGDFDESVQYELELPASCVTAWLRPSLLLHVPDEISRGNAEAFYAYFLLPGEI